MFPHERIFFKARATKERVPLINARMSGRCLHASGSYKFFCMNIKLNFFVLIPGDQEGLFKLAIQLRTFFYSAIYNTATGYVLWVQ
jgi:hypothetical protein